MELRYPTSVSRGYRPRSRLRGVARNAFGVGAPIQPDRSSVLFARDGAPGPGTESIPRTGVLRCALAADSSTGSIALALSAILEPFCSCRFQRGQHVSFVASESREAFQIGRDIARSVYLLEDPLECGNAYWLLDSPTGVAGVQNWYNLRAEKALSSFDTHQRLVISYVYDLPFGKGRTFLSGASGLTDKLVSGWGINGLTTFQKGLPLGFTATPNTTGFNTGLRPNVAPNCNVTVSGSAQSRLNGWFNTSCFSLPAPFTFGNESRTDPVLRGPGIANYDFAVFKRTPITERFNLEFRAEAFNLFNRVQFGQPNVAYTTAANSTFGQISTQLNQPRLMQMALRLRF